MNRQLGALRDGGLPEATGDRCRHYARYPMGRIRMVPYGFGKWTDGLLVDPHIIHQWNSRRDLRDLLQRTQNAHA